jgi:hypothetical protein
VERTSGWFGRYRRLSKDYEHNPTNHEAWIYLTTIPRLSRFSLPEKNKDDDLLKRPPKLRKASFPGDLGTICGKVPREGVFGSRSFQKGSTLQAVAGRGRGLLQQSLDRVLLRFPEELPGQEPLSPGIDLAERTVGEYLRR